MLRVLNDQRVGAHRKTTNEEILTTDCIDYTELNLV
jgi:hypothetical protein